MPPFPESSPRLARCAPGGMQARFRATHLRPHRPQPVEPKAGGAAFRKNAPAFLGRPSAWSEGGGSAPPVDAPKGRTTPRMQVDRSGRVVRQRDQIDKTTPGGVVVSMQPWILGVVRRKVQRRALRTVCAPKGKSP